MQVSQADAAQWIAAARGGSTADLGMLLQQCRQFLLLVADQELGGALRGELGASDLVQETFVEAQRDFQRFQGDTIGQLRAWLRRMLLNNLRDASRRAARPVRDEHRRVAAGADCGVERLCHLVSTNDPTPSGCSSLNETVTAVRNALDHLSAEYRQVITLRNLEIKSFVEIGELMGRTPDAARKLWRRAIDALGRQLGELHAV